MTNKLKLQILKKAKKLLWDGAYEIKSKEQFICLAIDEAGGAFGAGRPAAKELRQEVSTLINNNLTLDGYLRELGIKNVNTSDEEMQCHRWMLLEYMIQSYKDK